PDVPALQAWARAHVVRSEDHPATVGLVQQPGPAALHGRLAGWSVEVQSGGHAKGQVSSSVSAWMAVAMLALVGVGVIVGLGAASREIAMSQRQTALVSRVSHELRTPLTSIHLFVEALRSGRLPPDRAAECLDLLSKETDRLSRRIEEVLSWARMEAGARRYRVDHVAPAEVVQQAVDAFRTQILFDAHDDLDLRVDVPDALPDLVGDRDALIEAVLNLLVNAFRHSESPRRIGLSAAARGRMVGLTVHDNGPGIDRRDRSRIFEKFYRPDEAERPPSTSGTGLGLAIVRAIVRAHRGRIELDSSPERGSAFTLWFPAA
ncbi:MAG TPA: HAMP domain-containing sensor histidine kinase, partial [Myxococcota bacterium]|nr:HAMP domain-containing sensor histidine kinase [Myxococcota bacterium]